MKPNSIIKSILLTATLSLIHKDDTVAANSFIGNNGTFQDKLFKSLFKNPIAKRVLSIKRSGELRVINQHFSHSSHSSHSSHYSASTGNNNSTSSQDYSSNSVYTAGGVVRGENGKNQFAPVSTNKDASLYKLGDRQLKQGLFGKDVEELTSFLISINILDKNKLEKSQSFVKFNKAVEESVKTFQSQNRLRPTGIVDTNLVKLINKKIKEKNNSK